MKQKVHLSRRWTFTIERQEQEIISDGFITDPHWFVLDEMNHQHTAAGIHDTFRTVVDEWGVDDYDGEEYAVRTHLECKLCGETITPRRVPAGLLAIVPTGYQFSATGQVPFAGGVAEYFVRLDQSMANDILRLYQSGEEGVIDLYLDALVSDDNPAAPWQHRTAIFSRPSY